MAYSNCSDEKITPEMIDKLMNCEREFTPLFKPKTKKVFVGGTNQSVKVTR